MDPTDVISLVLAIYAAILSSYLGYRGLRKERRNIRVYLDHAEWVERFYIIVVNVGHRPVTIVEVALRPINRFAPSENYPIYPSGNEGAESPSLPMLLGDGEAASFLLPENVGRGIYASEQMEFLAYARDAEGKEYSTSKVRRFNAKYGVYSSSD